MERSGATYITTGSSLFEDLKPVNDFVMHLSGLICHYKNSGTSKLYMRESEDELFTSSDGAFSEHTEVWFKASLNGRYLGVEGENYLEVDISGNTMSNATVTPASEQSAIALEERYIYPYGGTPQAGLATDLNSYFPVTPLNSSTLQATASGSGNSLVIANSTGDTSNTSDPIHPITFYTYDRV